MLDRIRTLIRRWRARREPRSTRIVLTDQGFDVVDTDDGRPVVSVDWRVVRSIRAYKVDLLAYDCICLAFQVGEDTWAEVPEHTEGFAALQQKMEEVFPSIPETWWSEVAFPPFATHETVLYPRYERRWPCDKCGYDLTGNVSGVCPECGTPVAAGGEKK